MSISDIIKGAFLSLALSIPSCTSRLENNVAVHDCQPRAILRDFEIEILNSQGVSLETAEKGISMGYSLADLRYINENDFERGIDFKKAGFIGPHISLFLEYNIPPDFAKDYRLSDSPLTLCKMHKAGVRKISKQPVADYQISYKDFSELDANSEDTEVPIELARFIGKVPYNINIKDKKEFEELVCSEARKLGLEMSNTKQIIKNSAEIVAHRLEWKDVDKDHLARGIKKSHDWYFNEGVGDCDKYASLVSAIFNIFNKDRGVYVLPFPLVKNLEEHCWNTIVVIRKNKLVFSDIDATFYDTQGKLEAGEFHIDRRNYSEKAQNFLRENFGKRDYWINENVAVTFVYSNQ